MCLDRAKTLYSGRCFTGMSSVCRVTKSVLNRNRPVNKPSSCGGFVEVVFVRFQHLCIVVKGCLTSEFGYISTCGVQSIK